MVFIVLIFFNQIFRASYMYDEIKYYMIKLIFSYLISEHFRDHRYTYLEEG